MIYLEMETNKKVGLFCLLLAALGVLAKPHIMEYDEYWRDRETTARKLAEQAYHPNPEEAVDELNEHVNRSIEGLNTTRRHLAGNDDSCTATNPIDRCWRCRTNWAKERKRLALCIKGFGRRATGGGLDGRFYVVTDSSDESLTDPKPGTLRHAVIQKRPLWITFAADMVIRLRQELIVQSDKTIDGRGAEVHIAHGAGITIQYVKNVIIHGIHIHGIKRGYGGLIRDSVDHFGLRTWSDGDGINIFGSSDIWLDHLTMSRCADGLIDATMGSTGITISNCFFSNQDKVMLFGASDANPEDEKTQVTLAFNRFGEGLVQRMPRCRRGYFHVLSNEYTKWQMYAIGGSMNPTIISQGNRFIAPDEWRAKQVTKRESATEDTWKHWVWKSDDDVMENGAYFVESGPPGTVKPSRHDSVNARRGGYASWLSGFSGVLDCRVGMAC